MSVSHKSTNTQNFRLMLYRRALHPELLDLQRRKVLRPGGYEVEIWLAPGGHVARFQHEDQTLTEAVIDKSDHLPEMGLIHAVPCIGEKDYQHEPEGSIGYVTTIQTEALTENLYMATYREMLDAAEEAKSMVHEWHDPSGASNLSIVDAQIYKRELHIQSYHLTWAGGWVLRTQSIFEVLPGYPLESL